MLKSCPNCNRQLYEQVAFCGGCGAKINPNNKSKNKFLYILGLITVFIVLIFIICFVLVIGVLLNKEAPRPRAQTTNITSPVISGNMQDFFLYNKTSTDIYYLYISPSDSDDWENDILDASILMSDEYIEITFDDYKNERYWDIRIEDADGGYAEWFEIDLFTIRYIYVYMDRDGHVQLECIEEENGA